MSARSVKLFTSSDDKDYVKALKIYSTYTPLTVKTNTNDITYWLDKYNRQFDDRLLIFGLYEDKQIIGFSQLVYFVTEKLIVIDYISIDQHFRSNGAFYSFIEEIQKEILTLNFDVNYWVTEIEYDCTKKSPTENGIILIRLLKLSGFDVLKALYYQPQLGYNNKESSTTATLMIHLNATLSSLSKESYLQIVKTIYFKHYLRWYTPLLEGAELKAYTSDLELLYTNITVDLSKSKIVKINGYSSLYNHNQAPRELSNTGLRFGILSFVVILCVISCTLYLGSYFHASIIETGLLILLTASLLFLFNSVSTGNGLREFDKLQSLFKFFGKNK